MGSVERNSAARAGTADSERPALVPESRIARRLCDERRKQKLSLDEVAEALKIRKSYVSAIESERFSELPGPTYALGFVGSYAQLLDLDRNDVVARFRDEIAGVNTENELKFLVPLKDGRFPGRAILAASAGLALAVYGGWYAYSSGGIAKPVADAGPPASRSSTKPVVAASAAAKADVEALLRRVRALPAAKTSANEPANKGEIAVGSQPKPKKTSRIHTLKSRQAARRAKALKAKAERAKAEKARAAKLAAEQAPASGKARIVLKALQDTWVQIQLADGTMVLSRILKAGDSYAVLKNRGLVLTAGNAGGLRIIVDGRVLPALGPKGAVRQGIRLDADALLASR